MKQTAVEWLVEQILTEVQDYEDGDIETESEPFNHEYVNKYHPMVDLSEFVQQAKQMEKEQSHKYAEFAIRCDRMEMKILNFEDWIKLETFK